MPVAQTRAEAKFAIWKAVRDVENAEADLEIAKLKFHQLKVGRAGVDIRFNTEIDMITRLDNGLCALLVRAGELVNQARGHVDADARQKNVALEVHAEPAQREVDPSLITAALVMSSVVASCWSVHASSCPTIAWSLPHASATRAATAGGTRRPCVRPTSATMRSASCPSGM